MTFRYRAVANQLKARIESLGSNSLLPSEEELARSFDVSRVTIRRALAVLEGNGLLERQRGRGTIVNPLKVERTLMPLMPIERDLLQQGVIIETEILSVKPCERPPNLVATRMRIASLGAVSVITLVRKVENRVIAFDRRYVHDALIGKARLHDVVATPIGEILARCAKFPVTAHGIELEFLTSPLDVSKVLNINPGTLVVRSLGTDFLENGEPHCVSAMYYRIDRVKFKFLSHYAPTDAS